MLAAKTALAVGISWFIALRMPGATDEYPYYAPLGVLVSMYPTLMDSLKTSVQTLFGLLAGIGLAFLVLLTWGPNVWTISLVAGAGIVLSGTGWFGAGREYVPIAALFVLIIGGSDFDDYSLGYATQMGVGAVVGLAVNLLIAPRTLTAFAAERVDAFRLQLAEHLRDIAEVLGGEWPPQREDWARNAASLGDTARDVRDALRQAETSRKGNPRARRDRQDPQAQRERLEQLERIAFVIRDVSEALADALWERPGRLDLDASLADPLRAACARVAVCVERTGEGTREAHEARAYAAAGLRSLAAAVDDPERRAHGSFGAATLIAMHLRRILELSRR
ncbi:hypothetical protein GCM10010910_06030 [Microbacterium nanhaiense]|uniref:FUSC family protein n=2 Tax=Microbacterium nanhaiense TaxID=1301026 RepID=A0ABQ2MZJ9_9MICO|nr:hypothetical protein GCM10010910_06030 [Microbacterium nanhaiense]